MSHYTEHEAEAEEEEQNRSKRETEVDEEDSENDSDVPNEYDLNDGFIVNDVDEDEEEDDEAGIDVRGKKRARDGKKKKKKKKKKDEGFGLEEVQTKKKRRLKRNKGSDDEELNEELNDLLRDQLVSKSKEQRTPRNEDITFDNEEEEDWNEDDDDGFIVGRRGGRTKNNLTEEDYEANEVFGVSTYKDQYDDEDEDEIPADNMGDGVVMTEENRYKVMKKLYGEEELKEQLLTEEDEKIRLEDIPERLQLKNIIRDLTEEEFKEESEWIFDNAFRKKAESKSKMFPDNNKPKQNSGEEWDMLDDDDDDNVKSNENVNEPGSSADIFDSLKSSYLLAIEKVLQFLHKMNYDIPFISHYRKEHFHPTLENDEDLWTIFEWDEKWVEFKGKINFAKKLYSKVSNIPEKYHDLLKNARSKEEAQDLIKYFNFNFGDPAEQTEQALERVTTFKRSSRKDLLALCKKNNIKELRQYFGITIEQYTDNLLRHYAYHKVQDHNVEPETTASAYVCKEFRNEQLVLKGARHMIAREIAAEPFVIQKARQAYEIFATISTKITQNGETSNLNVLRSIKNLHKVPLSSFTSDDEKMIQFIQIMRAERDGFLSATIEVEEEHIDTSLRFKDFFFSDKVNAIAQSWNKQRELIVEEVRQLLHPTMEQHVRYVYMKDAKQVIANLCQSKLEKMLMAGPFGHRRPEDKYEDDMDSRDVTPTRCRVLGCCIPLDHNQPTAFVMLDENGVFLDKLVWKFSPFSKGDRTVIDSELMTQYFELRTFISLHMPHAIAIAASGRECTQLKERIEKEVLKGTHIPAYYIADDVAKIYESSSCAKLDFATLPSIFRRAISVARRLNDPLSEIAQLCNKEKDISCLKFHYLQDMLQKKELESLIEKTFIRVVNKVGVNLNRISKHKHLQNTLQFVGGLGPRKAKHLLKKVNNSMMSMFTRRKDIIDEAIGPTVFLNCAGFLKITSEDENNEHFDILDSTRIHPDDYDFALKMSVDACEEDEDEPNDDISRYVYMVMEHPERLEDLDLDAYADELEKRSLGKKHITLKDIKREFENPYADPRNSFARMTNKDLFYSVTGESEEAFSENHVVTVKVMKLKNRGNDDNQKTGIECKLENDLDGLIPHDNMRNQNNQEDLSPGSFVEAKIDHINYDKFLVILNPDPSEVDLYKEPEPAKPIPKKKIKPRIQRNINHPSFKNMNYPEALSYLKDKEPGELVIRPSSKGENHLTVTFKFFGGTYINLDVKEEGKLDKFSLGKELWVQGKKYDDLDEICFRCVQCVIDHARTLMQNEKFVEGSPEEIEAVLFKEKQKSSSRIPYRISLNKDYPGRFLIHYLPNKRVKREHVTITPHGYSFFKRTFSNPLKLLNAFKRSYKDGSAKRHSSSHHIASENRNVEPAGSMMTALMNDSNTTTITTTTTIHPANQEQSSNGGDEDSWDIT